MASPVSGICRAGFNDLFSICNFQRSNLALTLLSYPYYARGKQYLSSRFQPEECHVTEINDVSKMLL
jgi:hypothetical protein